MVPTRTAAPRRSKLSGDQRGLRRTFREELTCRAGVWLVLLGAGCAKIIGAEFDDVEPVGNRVTASGGSAGDSSAAAYGDFPRTPLLDDFTNESTLEDNWDAEFTYFYVTDGELICRSCSVGALWSEVFGARQEAYTEVRSLGADAIEYNLILRAQCAYCGLIEALYDPREQAVYVAYCVDDCLDLNHWVYSEPASVKLEVGDQFGARIDDSNLVEIYKNGSLVSAHRVAGFPYMEGQIGVSGIQDAGQNAYDDFGGGDW